MADWAGGYSAEFAIAEVNPKTWTASSSVEGLVSLSKSASCTEDVPLLEQASVEVDGAFEAGWYQLLMFVGSGSREKVELGVFKFTRSSVERDHGIGTVSASGLSVLNPANNMRMTTGDYAPSGVDGAQEAARLLRAAIPAPVEVEGGFSLSSNVTYGIGMTYLEAAWLLVSAGGYCMQLGGDGVVHIRPKPSEPALELNRANANLLVPGIQDTFDIGNVKNRYYAIEGGNIVVAENHDPDSEASFENLGEWNDEVDSSCVRVNGETLAAYAQRKLAEQSVVTRLRVYTREYWPDVVPFSVVRGSMSDMELDGDMIVTAQSFAFDYGVTVTETAEQAVRV